MWGPTSTSRISRSSGDADAKPVGGRSALDRQDINKVADLASPALVRRGNRICALRYRNEERACAVKRRHLSSGWKSHPATAPAGSNRSSCGGNEMAEAFG